MARDTWEALRSQPRAPREAVLHGHRRPFRRRPRPPPCSTDGLTAPCGSRPRAPEVDDRSCFPGSDPGSGDCARVGRQAGRDTELCGHHQPADSAASAGAAQSGDGRPPLNAASAGAGDGREYTPPPERRILCRRRVLVRRVGGTFRVPCRWPSTASCRGSWIRRHTRRLRPGRFPLIRAETSLFDDGKRGVDHKRQYTLRPTSPRAATACSTASPGWTCSDTTRAAGACPRPVQSRLAHPGAAT